MQGASIGDGLVGRDLSANVKRRESGTCHECCTGDLCNQNLCAFEAGKHKAINFRSYFLSLISHYCCHDHVVFMDQTLTAKF